MYRESRPSVTSCFSQITEKLNKTKDIPPGETEKGKVLILLLHAWVRVQENLSVHYNLRKKGIIKNGIVMTMTFLEVQQTTTGRATYRPCARKITAGMITEIVVNVNWFGRVECQVMLHIIAFIMVKLGYKDIALHHITMKAQRCLNCRVGNGCKYTFVWRVRV